MNIRVSKSIAPPVRKPGKASKYPFARMSPGDSIPCPTYRDKVAVSQSLRHYLAMERKPGKVRTACVNKKKGTFRVWWSKASK